MPILTIRRHGVTSGCPGTGSNPGIKTDVQGWSQSSTRSNLRFLYSVDEGNLTGHGFAVTLTLKHCPLAHADWHRLRSSWIKRLRRAGLVRLHWVTEWQRRGVPHLHAAVYLTHDDPAPLMQSWLAVAAEYGATEYGQHITPIWDQLGFAKYVAKHAARGLHHYQRSRLSIPDGWKKTGRMWGKSGDWPTGSELKLAVDQAAWYRWRRLVRRYRIADARAGAFPARARRISTARRMLQGRREASAVRGVSEWIPQELSLRLLGAAATAAEIEHV